RADPRHPRGRGVCARRLQRQSNAQCLRTAKLGRDLSRLQSIRSLQVRTNERLLCRPLKRPSRWKGSPSETENNLSGYQIARERTSHPTETFGSSCREFTARPEAYCVVPGSSI